MEGREEDMEEGSAHGGRWGCIWEAVKWVGEGGGRGRSEGYLWRSMGNVCCDVVVGGKGMVLCWEGCCTSLFCLT